MAVGREVGPQPVVRPLLQPGPFFDAEVLRVRMLLDLATAGPLLFLLDELFAGTSSHDRRMGAEAVVRTFLERGAIGLATTHDLSLTEIAEHHRLPRVLPRRVSGVKA